jgi:hypothetical protein
MNNKKKLNEFFRLLRKNGFTALQNNMCCQSCGWSIINDRPEEKTKNVIFYHDQDREEFKNNGGKSIMLAWRGDGKKVCELASSLGLETEWDGSEGDRIELLFI